VIRVGIAGAAGKMGRALVRATAEHSDLTLGAAWERSGHAALGQDAGELAGAAHLGVALSAAETIRLEACDVLIDFTAPEPTVELAQKAAQAGRALVIGTTGLKAEQIETLRAAAQKVPVIYATNFSMGVNLLWQLARQTAAALGEAFDIEIIEEHFRDKKDVSGTALRIAEDLGLDKKQHVSSIRVGGIIGKHEVVFGLPNQTIRIIHESLNRAAFGQGAIYAAKWLLGKANGIYTMEEAVALSFVKNPAVLERTD